ncbi:DUF2515 family protein [Radiobacillus sp. PE A8.2]|uniref:DUF2515 family protein n=1 Tax=Radiobacillus sp. PE A8.2 TaxID=3380349 RepID=UPI00388D7605
MNNTEKKLCEYIDEQTRNNNIDNISRTLAYQQFYLEHQNIKWAYLASMVSRNAGWNMTDLETSTFKHLLTARIRKQLFSTYERANWLIFSDAYPQLLLYQFSKERNEPLFHLLSKFAVSPFMQKEWFLFWKFKDENRLVTSLIINEQNVINNPVTKHPFYKKNVFLAWPYLVQDFFLLNAVVFPTCTDEAFATPVHDFTNITKRITLGKRLASILFHPSLYNQFYNFTISTDHTGSRYDYQQYMSSNQKSESPKLRDVYPVIDHQDKIRKDWHQQREVKEGWWEEEHVSLDENQWDKYSRKQKIIRKVVNWKQIKSSKKN